MSVPLGYPEDSVLTTPLQSESEPIKRLRQLKYLAIVGVDLSERKDNEPPETVQEREIWRRELISILKDSPSKDRKILRWRVVQSYRHPGTIRLLYDVVEDEELEVLPEASL